MKNERLKTLFKEQKFDEILKITKDKTDYNSVLYRIYSFVELNKLYDALDTLKSNRETLEQDLLLCMDTHFAILSKLNLFDEAYDEILYYQNLPYVNQETEEHLKELPKIVRKLEKESYLKDRNVTKQDDLDTILNSSDSYQLILAMNELPKRATSKEIAEICLKLCSDETRDLHQFVRTFALLNLVELKYDKEIDFIYDKKIRKLTPNKLEKPFENDSHNEIIKIINNVSKNPSIQRTCGDILNQYEIQIFPRSINRNVKIFAGALLELANEYLKTDLEELTEQIEILGVNEEEVFELKREIDSDSKKFPPISK